ncbi:MAG: glycoside hydrolase family 88 protein [Clostridiales bacterium]|jgi:unsaturated chondroitin disaccharide hydrolase|nr:glycoside hydrolase family 88 protein [Clostridiales bacterium]
MLRQLAQKERNGVIAKIDKNMLLYRDKTPCISETARYSDHLSADGDWTASFWTGMVVMAGALTGEAKYSDYLEGLLPFYQNRLDFGWKDHDLGFLYQLYALDAYRLTNDCRYAKMAVSAAETLMHRYDPRGGFLRAWGKLIDPYRAGKLIIDCQLNLPLLFCAAQMSGNDAMRTAAHRHAEATLNVVRADGSTFHTFDFDCVTGKPLRGETEGGFSDDSCWSRGQSWGIYGFYLAYFHTSDTRFLRTAETLADYFIARLDENNMPKWDFKLPGGAPYPDAIDTSAAAIAASALYDLSGVVSAEKAAAYVKAADAMLLSLIQNHSRVFDDGAEALLEKCYCGGVSPDGTPLVRQWSAIFGDYFYMEALMKKSGTPIHMWRL